MADSEDESALAFGKATGCIGVSFVARGRQLFRRAWASFEVRVSTMLLISYPLVSFMLWLACKLLWQKPQQTQDFLAAMDIGVVHVMPIVAFIASVVYFWRTSRVQFLIEACICFGLFLLQPTY